MERQLQLQAEEKSRHSQCIGEVQQSKQQVHPTPSPSHEFSFAAISLHHQSPPPPLDLSPADEIFFHGHLLPLHLLSHLPPRASTDTALTRLRDNYAGDDTSYQRDDDTVPEDPKQKQKSKLQFSLFRIPSKWRPRASVPKSDSDRDRDKSRKSKFDAVKRYLRLIRPGFLLRKGNKNSEFLRQQQYSSYSGNLRMTSIIGAKWARGRRGECYASAPATMGNSPTNSGVLLATPIGALTPTAAKSDSTMEELQAAIQAAIAHCKKSIANHEDVMSKLPSHD